MVLTKMCFLPHNPFNRCWLDGLHGFPAYDVLGWDCRRRRIRAVGCQGLYNVRFQWEFGNRRYLPI